MTQCSFTVNYRLRRRPNCEPTLDQRLVNAGWVLNTNQTMPDYKPRENAQKLDAYSSGRCRGCGSAVWPSLSVDPTQIGPGRYSDRSLFRQLDIPTGRCSDRSIFRQTGRYSDRSLFRQVDIPTGRYSDRSIFRQTGRYSDRLIVRQTGRYSDRSIVRQTDKQGRYSERSIFRQVVIPT